MMEFESKDGTMWNIVCDIKTVCNGNSDKCDNLIEFDDGTVFLVDAQRRELFDYLRKNKAPLVTNQ